MSLPTVNEQLEDCVLSNSALVPIGVGHIVLGIDPPYYPPLKLALMACTESILKVKALMNLLVDD